MSTITRRSLMVGAFCLLLCATNWEWSHHFDRKEGIQNSSVDLTGFTVLFTFICAVGAVHTVWKELRSLLDQGTRIPSALRLLSGWRYVPLLLPLFVHISPYSTKDYVLADGTNVHYALSYGSDLSAFVFLFGAITILSVNMLWTIDDYLMTGFIPRSDIGRNSLAVGLGKGNLSPGTGHA